MRLLAESLLRVGFEALDRLPDDQKRALAKRIGAGVYDRMAGNPAIGFSASEPSADAGRGAEPSGPAYGPVHGK
jgi:hypothetical protein